MKQGYALKRLVRGLGSGHDAARQGFSLALAAALVRVPEIESLPALDMLEAALEVSKSTRLAHVAFTPSLCYRSSTRHALPSSHAPCTDAVQHKLPAPATAPARPETFLHAPSLHRWLEV